MRSWGRSGRLGRDLGGWEEIRGVGKEFRVWGVWGVGEDRSHHGVELET